MSGGLRSFVRKREALLAIVLLLSVPRIGAAADTAGRVSVGHPKAPTAKIDPKHCVCTGKICSCELRASDGTTLNLNITKQQYLNLMK